MQRCNFISENFDTNIQFIFLHKKCVRHEHLIGLMIIGGWSTWTERPSIGQATK